MPECRESYEKVSGRGYLRWISKNTLIIYAKAQSNEIDVHLKITQVGAKKEKSGDNL